MNPRDLPEVVAELIVEMHEVRSELKAINGRLDRLEGTMEQLVQEQQGMRQDMQALPEQIGTATIRALEPFLNRLPEHDDQLKNPAGRLNNLESPQK
jgi:chromosome segregation ATPase